MRNYFKTLILTSLFFNTCFASIDDIIELDPYVIKAQEYGSFGVIGRMQKGSANLIGEERGKIYYYFIASVLEDSNAHLSGLKTGDKIVAINKYFDLSKEEFLLKFRSIPINSKVELTIVDSQGDMRVTTVTLNKYPKKKYLSFFISGLKITILDEFKRKNFRLKSSGDKFKIKYKNKYIIIVDHDKKTFTTLTDKQQHEITLNMHFSYSENGSYTISES